jgi:hypothetical protein
MEQKGKENKGLRRNSRRRRNTRTVRKNKRASILKLWLRLKWRGK